MESRQTDWHRKTSFVKGRKTAQKIEEQLAALKKLPQLVRSFFKAPSVAYISDC